MVVVRADDHHGLEQLGPALCEVEEQVATVAVADGANGPADVFDHRRGLVGHRRIGKRFGAIGRAPVTAPVERYEPMALFEIRDQCPEVGLATDEPAVEQEENGIIATPVLHPRGMTVEIDGALEWLAHDGRPYKGASAV